jgi:hypothetical protein
MDHAFGPVYARSLASDLVIGALGSRTAAEALAAGTAPRRVWEALCDAMEVDDSLRWRHREGRQPPRSK